jgi:hypothetical protein
MLDALLDGLGRDNFADFTGRYERGAPWDAITDDETVAHYDRIADEIGQDEYRQAAEVALAHLSPEERKQLVAEMQQNARRTDVNYPGVHGEGLDDANALAGLLSQMHGERRGMVRQLVAGGGFGAEGATESLGAGLPGMSGRTGAGILSSPVARAALAGIAVTAVKQFMAERR